jgi:hypothetical protein
MDTDAHRSSGFICAHLYPSVVPIRGYSLCAPNAWIDEALHDIDQKVEQDKKRRQHENRPL